MKFFMLKKILELFLIIKELEFQKKIKFDDCLFGSNLHGVKKKLN